MVFAAQWTVLIENAVMDPRQRVHGHEGDEIIKIMKGTTDENESFKTVPLLRIH